MKYNIKMIFITDRDGNIGKNNDLLYWFSEDLKRFKELTKGKTIVMGRKTWDSLPNVLSDRTSIVVSSSIDNIKPIKGKMPDAYVGNFKSILKLAEEKEIWIIGGATLYNYFIDYANELYWTYVDDIIFDADTYVKEEQFVSKFNKLEAELMFFKR